MEKGGDRDEKEEKGWEEVIEMKKLEENSGERTDITLEHDVTRYQKVLSLNWG